MTTKYENGVLSFEENQDEKVFCVMGTFYADGGERTIRVINEKQIAEEGWEDHLSVPIDELEIGDSAIYGYWYQEKAAVITRLA